MVLDCNIFMETCATCSKQKQPTTKARASLINYIFRPHVHSWCGNHYGVVDQFSKWVEIWALSGQSAELVAENIFEQWVTKYGIPIQIHNDQVRNFDRSLSRSFCNLLDVVKTRTSYINHLVMGKWNGTTVILQFIRCILEGKQNGLGLLYTCSWDGPTSCSDQEYSIHCQYVTIRLWGQHACKLVFCWCGRHQPYRAQTSRVPHRTIEYNQRDVCNSTRKLENLPGKTKTNLWCQVSHQRLFRGGDLVYKHAQKGWAQKDILAPRQFGWVCVLLNLFC